MSVIDDYLKDLPTAEKRELERIRAIVKQTVPDAEEVITYGMPGFKYNQKYLIAFAPFKDHMSIFPGAGAIETLWKKLSSFRVAKGTIQFTADNPIPESIIKDLVSVRLRDINS